MSLTITGPGLWRSRPDTKGAERMVGYVERVAECQGRCETCAFRTGTDANASRLVLHLVEMCLANGDTFMCHTGLADDEDPHRPCAGFTALRAARLSGGTTNG
jgi:hypothetical protein